MLPYLTASVFSPVAIEQLDSDPRAAVRVSVLNVTVFQSVFKSANTLLRRLRAEVDVVQIFPIQNSIWVCTIIIKTNEIKNPFVN